MTPTILRSPERQKEGYECMYVIFSMYACGGGLWDVSVCVCHVFVHHAGPLAVVVVVLFGKRAWNYG